MHRVMGTWAYGQWIVNIHTQEEEGYGLYIYMVNGHDHNDDGDNDASIYGWLWATSQGLRYN